MTNPWEEAQALNYLKDVLRGGAAFVGSNLHLNRDPSTYDPGQITDHLDILDVPYTVHLVLPRGARPTLPTPGRRAPQDRQAKQSQRGRYEVVLDPAGCRTLASYLPTFRKTLTRDRTKPTPATD